MAKITYDNKITLNPQPSIADANKCTANDLNEIKESVNALYDMNEVSGWNLIDSGFGCYYKKMGNIVSVRCQTTVEKTLAGFTSITIGTLPEGSRPSVNIRGTTYARGNSGSSSAVYFEIKTNGEIKLFNWEAAITLESGALAFITTYLL